MALTFTALTSGSDSTSASIVNTASISISSGELLVVCAAVSGSGTQDVPLISTPGVETLVAQNSRQTARTVTMAVFSYTFGGTGSVAIEHPSGSSYTSFIWSIFKITGHDTTTPIIQSNAQGGSDTNVTVSLTSAVTDSNGVFGVIHSNSNVTLTPTNGGTEIHDLGENGPTSSLATQYHLTPSIDGISGDFSGAETWRGIVFEIAPDAGGGGTVHQPSIGVEALGPTDTVAKTVTKGKTDTLGLTDSFAKSQSKGRTDSLSLTDEARKTLGKSFFDSLSLQDEVTVSKAKLINIEDLLNSTDAIEITLVKNWTDEVSVSDLVSFVQGKVKSDNVNLTDTLSKTQSKGKSDNVDLSDTLAKTQGKGTIDSIDLSDSFSITKFGAKVLESAVNLTDSIWISIKKVFTHSTGLTDSLEGVSEGGEGIAMSLVDTARENYQTAFGVSDADMAELSINDVMHRYWSGDFPLSHAYDGSESSFTPDGKFSTMDHFAEVEKNEGTILNWIRSII